MQYRLYKLAFDAPVRFGADIRGASLERTSMTCHADTLFSALCTEAAAREGGEGAARLIESARDGHLLFSDLFPYRGEDLYLPRPVLPPMFRDESSRESPLSVQEGMARRKEMKKLAYLPVAQYGRYLTWLAKGGYFNLASQSFGESQLAQRVNRRSEPPLPYMVGAFSFQQDAGLYFISAARDSTLFDQVDDLVDSLGHAGIGGKRSAGYGKFHLSEDPISMDSEGVYPDDAALYAMLTETRPDYHMALSVVLPAAAEAPVVARGWYTLTLRSGFVNSAAYAENAVKRHSIHMLNAGSCLPSPIEGQVVDVAAGGGHPVCRYGRGLYAGLKL